MQSPMPLKHLLQWPTLERRTTCMKPSPVGNHFDIQHEICFLLRPCFTLLTYIASVHRNLEAWRTWTACCGVPSPGRKSTLELWCGACQCPAPLLELRQTSHRVPPSNSHDQSIIATPNNHRLQTTARRVACPRHCILGTRLTENLSSGPAEASCLSNTPDPVRNPSSEPRQSLGIFTVESQATLDSSSAPSL